MVRVTKMHALGNNYIYVSEFEQPLDERALPRLATAVSDVRRGIGSDGLIWIGPSDTADLRMRIFNADGSEAETCGNGLRCVAKFAFDRGFVNRRRFTIETRAGIVTAEVHLDGGQVHQVTVDMGIARFGTGAVPYGGPERGDSVSVAAAGETFHGVLVSMGNPHFVCFVDQVDAIPLARVGPEIERHPHFPERINVEFVAPRGRGELDFRVWERGSGITYACGSGACASVAAGIRLGLLDPSVTVHLQGGDLRVEVQDGRVWMTGEAVEVMTGQFHWPR
ncbi:diaminopimelate epimerase [Alicyclobacillus macrosporangiidus]|uniref:diaminopimelate epimerase n=1 Tax=Alicyclobacillus macrosporangiidus TaxID=392015 RepID=UPI0004971EB5|nr:diaminopimelate epimerase [Alicyclobacillus macrosporangiidus]